MPMPQEPYVFGIVGLGPRGNYALECLVESLIDTDISKGVKFLAFEQTTELGNGPVYAVDQVESNWINITERVLELPERCSVRFGEIEIPHFASYHDWAGLDFEDLPDDRTDTFPPRAQMGRYLRDRFQSLQAVLLEAGILEIISDTATSITHTHEIWNINTKAGTAHRVDDILLTVGHQPTNRDKQIVEWTALNEEAPDIQLFDEPYPVERILAILNNVDQPQVAIRGYGLATIDVLRALAQKYGKFEIIDPKTGSQRYVANGAGNITMVPFTRDGLTLGPKPLNPAIDKQYAPSDDAMEGLRQKLSNKAAQTAATNEKFLIELMCPIIASIYTNLENKLGSGNISRSDLQQIISSWIDDQFHEHESIMSAVTPPHEVLEKLIGMATGELSISLDYCIGQVWRHCQPTIYAALSHSALSDEVMAKIIFVDESLKRYSYGPPVESHQQLKALHDAGVLKLNFLADPEIQSNHSGWTFSSDGAAFKAAIMVDAVLDAPNIKAVRSQLLVSLLDDGLINPVHDDLGISTREDAYIVTKSESADVPIALLGRLSKGTVIGVDAILECFGDRPETWSRSAVSKAVKALNLK